MSFKTDRKYFKSLKKLKRNVYVMGEKIEDVHSHPMILPSTNSVAMTYKLAEIPEYKELFTLTSPIINEKINRFTHIQCSREDMIQKIKMLRIMGQQTASCFQRCAGLDCLNSVYSTTYDIDKFEKTKYHARFLSFLKYVQEEDLVCAAAMTDPRGVRSLLPHQQLDPDLYLRIVKEKSDGIIVRGAKFHQTGALNSHEIVVMPSTAMQKESRNYAVVFALPSDTSGITYIHGRQSCDTRKLENEDIDVGNFQYGGHEAMIIFDDVYVPSERVFMCKEYDYAGTLVERFASYHRASYGGCKAGVGDVLIGAAAIIADYHGISSSSHIRNKLIEMSHLNETLYIGGIASSAEGHKLQSGNYLVDVLLANHCKLNVTRFPWEIARLAQDIAGGILVTMPSSKSFKIKEISKYLNKYLKGINEISVEKKVRVLRLIENITMGEGAVGYLTESIHGAGSPQAQKIMIERCANLDYKKQLAKKIAGIK